MKQIEFADPRQFRQIAPIALQGFVSGFRVLGSHTLASAYLTQSLHQPIVSQTEFLEQPIRTF